MIRDTPPTRVPCGVCTETITGWDTAPDGPPVAAPCGHTRQEILDQGERTVRVVFGEHTPGDTRRDVELAGFGLAPGDDAQLQGVSYVIDRAAGRGYIIPGGPAQVRRLPDSATARDVLTDPADDDEG
jgi:hypothetical protein